MFLWNRRIRRVYIGAIVVAALGVLGFTAWRHRQIYEKTYRIGYGKNVELFRPAGGGQRPGLAIELMEEAARRAGIRYQWVYDGEGAENAMLSGRVDIWPHMHNKDYLRSHVYFSRPFLDSQYSLIRAAGATGQPGPGSRLAVLPGIIPDYIARRKFPGVEVKPVAGYDGILSGLCAGAVEFAVVGRARAVLLAEDWPRICALPMPLVEAVSSPELAISIAAQPAAAGAADALRDALDDMFEERPLAVFAGRYFLDVAVGGNLHRTLGGMRRTNQFMMSILAAVFLMLSLAVWVGLKLIAANRSLRDFVVERERLIAEVKKADNAKTQFVANLSHELCTPMNGILGAMDLLKDTPLEPNEKELVRTAADSGNSLLALITQLLDYSQLEANQLPFEIRVFSMLEVVETMAQIAAGRALEKGIAFYLIVDPAAPVWLEGDPQRLRRILECLLHNAVKFTPAGRVRLRLTAGEGEVDGACVEVSDTGPGIPAALRERIFEAFEQADPSTTRLFGGLGIGLAMASQLARKMGGRISLESVEGKGSRFTLHLPKSMLCPVPAGQAPIRAPRQGRGKPRVVVIHGDEDARRAVLATVAAAGFGAIGMRSFPAGGLVGDAVTHIFVEEAQLAQGSPSWPPAARLVVLYPRGAADRVAIPGRSTVEIASPFLPSEVRHALAGGAFASGPPLPTAGPRAQTPEGLGLHVLLVDDSRTNLKIAEQILQRMGCAVTTAENGELALRALDEADTVGNIVDLVLMDCQMPVMDGYEATRRIRQSSAAYQSVPVIALTAQQGEPEREHCLSAGMSDYTTKPISRQSLWRTLQRYGCHPKHSPLAENSDECSKTLHKAVEMDHSPGSPAL